MFPKERPEGYEPPEGAAQRCEHKRSPARPPEGAAQRREHKCSSARPKRVGLFAVCLCVFSRTVRATQ